MVNSVLGDVNLYTFGKKLLDKNASYYIKMFILFHLVILLGISHKTIINTMEIYFYFHGIFYIYIYIMVCVHAQSLRQSCLTLCDPMDYSLPGSSIHGISQARILGWVAISSCRGSSQPKDRTCVSWVFCIGMWILYHWPPGKHLLVCVCTHIYSQNTHTYIYIR